MKFDCPSYNSYEKKKKKKKITAEEQDTVPDKPGKFCSEKKASKRKWLATLCLSSSRQQISENNWNRYSNDFATTTQVQGAVQLILSSEARYLSHVLSK